MAKDLMLVIDMQNVYASNGKWCCHATEDAAVNIKRVIREKPDLDVIFTRFLAPTEPRGVWQEYHRVNEDVNEDAFANAMLSRFNDELEKYPLYSKSTYSSLTIPEVRLAATQAERVVISGVVAECCVLSTVMALIDEGVSVVYLTDAVSGVSTDTQAAVELILSGMEPVHVRLMTTAAYLQEKTKKN